MFPSLDQPGLPLKISLQLKVLSFYSESKTPLPHGKTQDSTSKGDLAKTSTLLGKPMGPEWDCLLIPRDSGCLEGQQGTPAKRILPQAPRAERAFHLWGGYHKFWLRKCFSSLPGLRILLLPRNIKGERAWSWQGEGSQPQQAARLRSTLHPVRPETFSSPLRSTRKSWLRKLILSLRQNQ